MTSFSSGNSEKRLMARAEVLWRKNIVPSPRVMKRMAFSLEAEALENAGQHTRWPVLHMSGRAQCQTTALVWGHGTAKRGGAAWHVKSAQTRTQARAEGRQSRRRRLATPLAFVAPVHRDKGMCQVWPFHIWPGPNVPRAGLN